MKRLAVAAFLLTSCADVARTELELSDRPGGAARWDVSCHEMEGAPCSLEWCEVDARGVESAAVTYLWDGAVAYPCGGGADCDRASLFACDVLPESSPTPVE